jgi:GcrA cell cycle regulator
MWTEKRLETLQTMWGEGNSASQIANRLGGVTRNAVIGKVRRLGLAPRKTTSRKQGQRAGAEGAPVAGGGVVRAPIQYELPFLSMPTAKQPKAPAPAVETTSPAPLRGNVLDLKECMCRWPIGDPRSADFHFCARQKAGGSSYCEHHSRIAFQPTERKQG